MGEQWPTDPEWRKFAARIADGVTRHINSGGRIGGASNEDDRTCRCPLGAAYTPDGPRFPGSDMARQLYGVSQKQAGEFIHGFEDNCNWDLCTASPFMRLGRAYRRRFIDKETT